MNKLEASRRMPSDPSRGRIWLVLAGVFTGLFMLNVVSRMLFIKQGIALWRLNDVGEFLLVLVAMAFFVVGILAAEKNPDPRKGNSHPPP